jgi:hypothetical protein
MMKIDSLDSDIKALNRLVGTWKISGDAQGQIKYEWMEGEFFLVQHVDLNYGGRKIKGIEIIGHMKQPNERPSKEIWSRFYSSLDGLTLDYVYELTDNILTVWFGHKGSDNHMKSIFDPSGNSFSAAWEWPGGGYKVTGTRLVG